ncbi:MAG: hypothetical protein V7731_06820 [Amphritea sp.]
MNKKTIFIILIAITAGVTYFLESQKAPITAQMRAAVEADLSAIPDKYPATPVWWADGEVLAVGMLPREGGEKRNDSAKEICQVLWKHNVNRTTVEIYDIQKIQKSDDWQQIGGADCRRQEP